MRGACCGCGEPLRVALGDEIGIRLHTPDVEQEDQRHCR